MNLKNLFINSVVSLGLFVLNPLSVFAQGTGSTSGNSDPNTGGTGSTSGNENPGLPIDLQNPLGGIDSIPSLVQAILDIVLTIGVPIIVIAIIYSGFKFIAAQGNPEKLKEAKQTLLYVLIGAAILLAAYAIAQAIVSTVTAIRG